jgi:hypothetical protein
VPFTSTYGLGDAAFLLVVTIAPEDENTPPLPDIEADIKWDVVVLEAGSFLQPVRAIVAVQMDRT